MKNSNFILASLVTVFCLQANAGLLFNYSQLAIKDLDQINKLVNDKVKESKKSSSGKVIPLREALQAVYSRPNEDDMIDKVVAPLRSNLDELDAWEKTISQLTDEAIGALKHPNTFKPVVQVTYAIFLENLLAEIKPLVKDNGFERKIAERIRDAKLEISKGAQDERSLRMMKSLVSPSEIANQILSQPVEPQAKTTETSAENSTQQQ
ncbi:hypothetical protein [Bdellovibrio svalbardensis]|uniref:Uncharacterized protein n=1 Tax=Bdellovibrio svalbardensis TaxID=2972972 RepID=A0ABT6DIW2_9BACT|nr:hypothetical protein [Bdellovibrio svalbardensis]MDG0816790.1 hypothetical protein [Bdellovibrio svalbardensis]